MKIKFETTVKTSENTKERLVCLDISENIKTMRFEHPSTHEEYVVKAKLINSINHKFRVSHCICRESDCGCWSTAVTLVAVDTTYGNAIAYMVMNKRI